VGQTGSRAGNGIIEKMTKQLTWRERILLQSAQLSISDWISSRNRTYVSCRGYS